MFTPSSPGLMNRIEAEAFLTRKPDRQDAPCFVYLSGECQGSSACRYHFLKFSGLHGRKAGSVEFRVVELCGEHGKCGVCGVRGTKLNLCKLNWMTAETDIDFDGERERRPYVTCVAREYKIRN